MANIKITLESPIFDGVAVTFRAPCDCSDISGLIVYWIDATEDDSGTTRQTFTFKDAHGNDLTGIGNLFSAGSVVKAILDTENGYAYLQNADTNKYVEDTFLKRVLTEGVDYGAELPTSGVKGQLFFKVVG